jgi:hypothetical protein
MIIQTYQANWLVQAERVGLNNDTTSIKRLDTTNVCEGVWKQDASNGLLL